MKTYRQAIQEFIAGIDQLYDTAGALRDCATEKEKSVWNEQRKYLNAIRSPLQKLDDSLSDSRANMPID